MLKKYASILRGIGIVIAALSLIGGIIVAVNTESFLYFIYCAIGAGLTCFFHSHLLNCWTQQRITMRCLSS